MPCRLTSTIPLSLDSDAGVPGIACCRQAGTQSVSDPICAVRHRDFGEVLEVLVSELTRHLQSERRTVVHRHFRAVHGVREQSLWMEGVVHVNAVPPIVEREEE